MEAIRKHNPKFLTLYDYLANAINEEPLGIGKNFSEAVRESKLFIIKNELIQLFNEEGKDIPPKIIPFNYESKEEKQPVLNLPFEKIFVEAEEEIPIESGFEKLNISFFAFLLEDGESIQNGIKDVFYFTVFIRRIGGNLATIPVRINKYERINKDGFETCHTEFGSELLKENARGLGFYFSKEDEKEFDQEFSPENFLKQNKELFNNTKTKNILVSFMWAISRIAVIATIILQYINSANSEIVYIGGEKKNYEKRVREGKTPIPPAHTIRLTNKIIRTGYLFNGKKFSPSYCFDVRGHYRTFRNQRFTKKVGQKIWISPFKRGRGEYVKKDYFISREDLRKKVYVD